MVPYQIKRDEGKFRHSKMSPEQGRKEVFKALGGPTGLNPEKQFAIPYKLEEESINSQESMKLRMPEFVNGQPFRLAVSLDMLEGNGYTQGSFKKACDAHFDLRDKERLSFESLNELFKKMKEEKLFENIILYVKKQQCYSEGLGDIPLKESEFTTAVTVFDENRQNLLANGIFTEDPQLQKKIWNDVSEISKRVTQFIWEQGCVDNWDSKKITRLLVAVYTDFYNMVIHQELGDSRNNIPDTTSLYEFSCAVSSVISNTYQALISNAPDGEHEKVMEYIGEIISKPLFAYRGENFDEGGVIFANTKVAQAGCSYVFYALTDYNGRKYIASKIDRLNQLDWIQDPPFNPKRTELQIPKGDFMVTYKKDETVPELSLCYRGRTGKTFIGCYDENIKGNDFFLCHSVTHGKNKYYPMESHMTFFVSAIDEVSSSEQNAYIQCQNQDWSVVSDIGLNLKYSGLQLLRNIEKIFPGVFDQAYNMDPIEIEVDQDESRLRITSSRSFLDRNLGIFDIKGKSVVSRRNALFDGEYYERQGIMNHYKLFEFANIDAKSEDNYIEIDNEEAIVLEFPLSYFIGGITETNTQEAPEVIEQKINDWKLISKHFSNASKNHFTYNEFLNLISLDGDIRIDETSGKGSHYKLFQVNGNGHFLTISNRKRNKGFYLIDLKSSLMSLGIDFNAFYERLRKGK